MHELEILRELLIVIVVSLLVVYAVRRVRAPAVVGFLVAGMLLGPGGFRLVPDPHTVNLLAEFGVALLLFTVGLRFSVAEMLRLRYWVFGAGLAQVALSIALTFGLARFVGFAPSLGLLLGFLLALSSTAIVLKLQEARGEENTPHGRLSLSILIFQDLAVVPLLLLVPMLGGGGSAGQLLLGLARSLGLLLLILGASSLLVPRLLQLVVGSRNPETFTLAVLAIAMGTAYVAGEAGLSLALGAFLAGIIISGTHYAHHVTAQVLPLRDALSSLFFVSVGMMVEPLAWLHTGAVVGGLTLGVILLKALVVVVVALLFGLSLRYAFAAGLALAQVGELSFLLAALAMREQLLDEASHQLFLSVAVLTMMLTPVLMALGTLWRPSGALHHRLLPATADDEDEEPLTDHVVLVGYGVNGRNVARALTRLEVPFVVLELNPRSVREMRDAGLRVVYGDACQEPLLRQVAVERARALVIAIAEPVAVRAIAGLARHLNPQLAIIVRTRFVSETEALLALGVNRVVAEEFETSLELVAQTMAAYGASLRDVEREKASLREQGYALLRDPALRPPAHVSLRHLLSESDLADAPVSAAAGQTIGQLDLRRRTGALVLGVLRGGAMFANPGPEFVLQAEDTVVLFGAGPALQTAAELLGSRTG